MVRRPVREGSSARSFVPSRTSSFTIKVYAGFKGNAGQRFTASRL